MTLHSNKLILIALCSASLLSACQEPRENPLLSKPTYELLNWIDTNKNAEVEACSEFWADPKTAPHSELVICEAVAKALIEEINYQGFVEGAIEKDLYLPVIWRELHKKFVIRAESKKETARQNEEVKSQPKSIFGNFPTNTKW